MQTVIATLNKLTYGPANNLPACCLQPFRLFQVERLVKVPLAPYQEALLALVKEGVAQRGMAGVSIHNSLMEMRDICNHPFLSKLHVQVRTWLKPCMYCFKLLVRQGACPAACTACLSAT